VLGQVLVVAMTQETNLMRTVVPPKAKRVTVVVLEPMALGASSALLVHVAAPVSVALMHRTPDRGRDMARGRGGVGLQESPPGSARLRVAPGFESFEFLGDGLLDDRGQVAVWHL